MGVIFMQNNLRWKMKQCVHIHSQTMNYHTGNVYLKCCAKCTCVNLPKQETDDQYSSKSHSILFHVYHIISHCTTNGRLT